MYVAPDFRVDDAGAHDVNGPPASERHSHVLANLCAKRVDQREHIVPVRRRTRRTNYKTPQVTECFVCTVEVLHCVVVWPDRLCHSFLTRRTDFLRRTLTVNDSSNILMLPGLR